MRCLPHLLSHAGGTPCWQAGARASGGQVLRREIERAGAGRRDVGVRQGNSRRSDYSQRTEVPGCDAQEGQLLGTQSEWTGDLDIGC